MGKRRRIPIEKLESDGKIGVTFCKRRLGLFSKASDLCSLFGARLAVLLTTPASRSSFYSFGYPNADAVVDAFLGRRLPDEIDEDARRSLLVDYQAARSLKKDRYREYVNSLEAKKRRRSGLWWEVEDFDRYETADELSEVIDRLQKLKVNVVDRLNRKKSSDRDGDGDVQGSDQGCSKNVGNDQSSNLNESPVFLPTSVDLVSAFGEFVTKGEEPLIESNLDEYPASLVGSIDLDSCFKEFITGDKHVLMENDVILIQDVCDDAAETVNEVGSCSGAFDGTSREDHVRQESVDSTIDFSFLDDIHDEVNEKEEAPSVPINGEFTVSSTAEVDYRNKDLFDLEEMLLKDDDDWIDSSWA